MNRGVKSEERVTVPKTRKRSKWNDDEKRSKWKDNMTVKQVSSQWIDCGDLHLFLITHAPHLGGK